MLREYFLRVRRFEEFQSQARHHPASAGRPAQGKFGRSTACSVRERYQDSPACYEYILTQRGLDLYPDRDVDRAWGTPTWWTSAAARCSISTRIAARCLIRHGLLWMRRAASCQAGAHLPGPEGRAGRSAAGMSGPLKPSACGGDTAEQPFASLHAGCATNSKEKAALRGGFFVGWLSAQQAYTFTSPSCSPSQ